ncbi:MAG: hypothetical protein FJ291_17150 [Planctomycetes bacterium]|nr:hypothetical protein [Planctomycetota bacterium]
MSKTSRWWPYIRAIGKALRIPGTDIGPGILVDMQDKLDPAEHRASVALSQKPRAQCLAPISLGRIKTYGCQAQCR